MAGDRVVVDGILKVQPGARGARHDARPRRHRREPVAAAIARLAERHGSGGRSSAGSRRGRAMISNFFIDRPLFATVVSAFIVIAGLAAFRELPVAMYPNIAPPQISVSHGVPRRERRRDRRDRRRAARAGAERRREHALHALEQLVGRRALDCPHVRGGHGPRHRRSSTCRTACRARCSCCPKKCAARASRSQKSLPSFLMILTFDSPDGRYDNLFVSNYATLNVIDELRRIQGVGNVQVFGARDYSIRIWLKPDRLARARPHAGRRRGRRARAERAVGGRPARRGADRRARRSHAQRHDAGAALGSRAVRAHRAARRRRRPRSCGSRTWRASSSARATTAFALTRKGRPVIGAALQLAPNANALQTAAAVYAKMDELAPSFPAGLVVGDSVRHEQVRAHVDARGGATRSSRRSCSCSAWCGCSSTTCARPSFRRSRCRCRWSARSRACICSASRSTL